ncbi:uncharacterized protein LOC125075156 isoform X1 [Vanessa atalanta]|uniref:uncharacterized protein LOC125075156 isoform X1 n=2 Tax=Vanessa atalanta TaxID=42275 RepID=UPI001FCD7133|nr:uncharacterized protein LOC125075156 isoform X1 [Vanessa atalanta]
MSDKCFGDYTTRNVVKNPLLSSAVTGLSIEDLTHNAVLLPAIPSQELMARQDQIETQMRPLQHSDRDTFNLPSGDANINTTHLNAPQNTNPNILDTNKHVYKSNNANSSLSKASTKSDDDFDVNEYFARLQGTRYVSAPLNSNIKEDQNDLQAEDNLEEINLNEPDKVQGVDDVQHSITSDIAQNFSQLPTVLPQVASAVFSSFSNMLNMKSREQTPDDRSYQETQATSTQFCVPDVTMQVAPPPLKEPPSIGTASNYRITTKKKVYAQIPGLSSGDSHVHFNPPTNQSAPPYFVEANVNAQIADIHDVGSKNNDVSIGLGAPHSVLTPQMIPDGQNAHNQKGIDERKSTFNVLNPSASDMSETAKACSDLVSPHDSGPLTTFEQESTTLQPIVTPQIPQPSATIIPPPPMFSNLPRRDGQASAGKSVLPPSVARRISGNQPILKTQVPPSVIHENIFVPIMPPEANVASSFGVVSSMHNYGQTFDPTSKIETINTTHNRGDQVEIDQNVQNLPSMSILQPAMYIPDLANATLSDAKVPCKADNSKELDISADSVNTSLNQKHIDTFISPTLYNPPAEIPNISYNPLAPSLSQITSPETKAPPTFYNPLQSDFVTSFKKENKDISTVPQNISSEHFGNLQPELQKPIQEPPKLSGNLSYRMSKKKPQYYSGPIEGVGNISNNIKPIIDPVAANSFQGSLFTPDQSTATAQNTMYPDYSMNSFQKHTPFDISKPASIETYPAYGPQTRNEQIQPDYNTAFDLSRQTTEKHEEPQESRGFGIIGSLKSKLSSLDINKIQNTVTTFFDPAYNAVDSNTKQEIDPYGYQNMPQSYPSYPQSDGATLEVFVPTMNQEQASLNPYSYQMGPTQSNDQTNQYYTTHDNYGNQNLPQTNTSSNYYAGWYGNYNQQHSLQAEQFQRVTGLSQEGYVESNQIIDKTTTKAMEEMQSTFNKDNVSSLQSESHKKEQVALINNSQTAEVTNVSTIFDNRQTTGQIVPEHKEILEINKQNIDTENLKSFQVTLDSTSKSFFDNPQLDIQSNDKTRTKLNELPSSSNDEIIQSNNSLKSIFDNSLSLENSTKENKIDNSRDYESDFISDVPKISQVFTDPSSKGFFDKQTSIVLPFAIKKPDDLKLVTKDDSSSVDVQAKGLNQSEPEISSIKDNVPNIHNQFGVSTQTETTKIPEDCMTIKKPGFKTVPDFKPTNIIGGDTTEHLSSIILPQESVDVNATTFSLFEQSPIIPSVPLFNLPSLSSISLPESVKDANINDIETKLENVSLFENSGAGIIPQPSYNLFGNVGSSEIKPDLQENQVSDLNTYVSCRDVSVSEENKVDDLTKQLIENVTAPIQLENPVLYPVLHDDVKSVEISDYSKPLVDISLIAQNILGSMIIPPPTDLLDDMSGNNPILNYPWPTNKPHASEAHLDYDYNFPLDSNPIGFLQDKSLFLENIPTNACDEIKAEYKNSQEETAILTHQISVPSAPPEEDTISDESGLDVHSIELDAKKDFPLFEDFVIEPSETDDDKIEYREQKRCSDDPAQDVDTFTNRVERFKKMESTPDSNDNTQEVRKEIKPFDLPTSTSPALTIASYFDTGNYAVENHYKNSITSPTTISSFNTGTSNQMRIPPGFEDEYRRRLSGVSSQDLLCSLNNQIAYIPDTSKNIHLNQIFTQETDNLDDEIICDSKVESMVEKLIDDDSSPTKSEIVPISNTIEPRPENADDVLVDKPSEDTKVETLPEPVVDISSEETKVEPSHEPVLDRSSEVTKVEPLPDPINFFSSNVESTEESEAYSDFSRLSSYFKTPPKPDHSKSFFELSESQNHYRHKSNDETRNTIQNNVNNFFKNTSTTNSTHIPQNHLANMALIRDLTSPNNLKPNDDTVKTVNYFTVEYNFNHPIEINSSEPINVDRKEATTSQNNETLKIGESSKDSVVNCKYCYNMIDSTNIVDNTGYKVKQTMETNSDTKKDTKTMNTRSENVVKKSATVNFCEQSYQDGSDDKIVVLSENRATSEHAPVKHHWFYQVDSEERSFWKGFSLTDSRALENAFNSPDLNENTLVATDGGRYDVNVMGRLKIAVYWEDKPTNVMRCSWFYKGTTDARYVPYAETIAEKLEEEYIHGITTGEWHRRLVLPNNELVVMHGPAVMVHFLQNSANDAFSSSPQSMMRPRVVRRGFVESEIEDTEPSSIDHLLLLCHGVGSACDMRFRPVEEVVDDFRATSLQLIQSHYKNSYDSGLVGRVEVLPISWHSSLHSGTTGVDRRLAAVTLESIPRLRNFTNDTILDVLFYTSPVFCQTIINTVCSELNRIYSLFRSRNPDFKGGVSLGGHSLGSVILYDLLCHQMPKGVPMSEQEQYVTGPAGTGQPCVKYPSLEFVPDAMYALGSPIAMFNCIRGVETLGKDFHFPTCKNFFNIFHPYDPIAYRIEPMINPELRDVKPFLIPHHKGRKRMHLELKDTMARVGADIKQKLIESIKNTWSSMWKTQPPPDQHLEKVVEEEMEKEELNAESKDETNQENIATADMLGKLNDGRRVDYVLQEAPFEMINEYLFAMRSHVCYWESEDTMLVMLREIYDTIGVSPDCSLPQQTLTVHRSKTILEDNDVAKHTDYPSTSRGSL